MLDIKVYRSSIDGDELIYDIELFNKVSVVLGNSAAGKSFLNSIVSRKKNDKAIWRVQCYDTSIEKEINVLAIESTDGLETFKTMSNTLFVIDEGTVAYIRESSINLEKYNNYFLLLDRDLVVKDEINVNAVYTMHHKVEGGYKRFYLEPFIKLERQKATPEALSKMQCILTEDTASGESFWLNVTSKLELKRYEDFGNASIPNNIGKALKECDGIILVALDYDRASAIMYKIARDFKNDLDRIRFIPLESLEEVICNSEFILSKFPELRDFVANYKVYMNCNCVSTGKYFSKLLFEFVKVIGPLKDPNGTAKQRKNLYKFYDKGMKNFKECFIDDCCSYHKEDCKLHYDGDKKQAMLANKFEWLRAFI